MTPYLETDNDEREVTHNLRPAFGSGESGLTQMLEADRRRRHEVERSAGMDHTGSILLPLALALARLAARADVQATTQGSAHYV